MNFINSIVKSVSDHLGRDWFDAAPGTLVKIVIALLLCWLVPGPGEETFGGALRLFHWATVFFLVFLVFRLLQDYDGEFVKQKSLIIGLSFLVATLTIVGGLNYFIIWKPPLMIVNALRFAGLQGGQLSVFIWDLAATISMSLYYIIFWSKMDFKSFTGRPLYILRHGMAGVMCLVLSTVCGFIYTIAAHNWGASPMPGAQYCLIMQAGFFAIASYWYFVQDYEMRAYSTNDADKRRYSAYARFIDLPMLVCASVLFCLTVVATVYADRFGLKPSDLSTMLSGATAMQIVFFNVAFAAIEQHA